MRRLFSAILLLSALCGGITQAQPADCTRTSTGRTPINDLGTGTYHGYEAGLYPGSNSIPPGYAEQAPPIVPVDGIVGVISVGMSNTSQEFGKLIEIAAGDAEINPAVRLVNGAQPGMDANKIANPADYYWTWIHSKVNLAGLRNDQILVAWLKEARARPTETFPTNAEIFSGQLAAIARNIRDNFPSIKRVYLSSRIYAGYATNNLSPEPDAYEGGFAVKWLVEDRILGLVDTPWLAWGPYLWADGLNARSDGLTWQCGDVRPSDGVHPSDPQGMLKVAGILLDWFKTDETTAGWFLANAPPPPPPPPPPAPSTYDCVVYDLETPLQPGDTVPLDATVICMEAE